MRPALALTSNKYGVAAWKLALLHASKSIAIKMDMSGPAVSAARDRVTRLLIDRAGAGGRGQCKSSSLDSRWDQWRHINSCWLSPLVSFGYAQTETNSFCFRFQLMCAVWMCVYVRLLLLPLPPLHSGFVFARSVNLGQQKLQAELGSLHFNFIFGKLSRIGWLGCVNEVCHFSASPCCLSHPSLSLHRSRRPIDFVYWRIGCWQDREHQEGHPISGLRGSLQAQGLRCGKYKSAIGEESKNRSKCKAVSVSVSIGTWEGALELRRRTLQFQLAVCVPKTIIKLTLMTRKRRRLATAIVIN